MSATPAALIRQQQQLSDAAKSASVLLDGLFGADTDDALDGLQASAVRAYDRAMSAAERFRSILGNLATCVEGRLEHIFADLSEAIELRPDSPPLPVLPAPEETAKMDGVLDALASPAEVGLAPPIAGPSDHLGWSNTYHDIDGHGDMRAESAPRGPAEAEERLAAKVTTDAVEVETRPLVRPTQPEEVLTATAANSPAEEATPPLPPALAAAINTVSNDAHKGDEEEVLAPAAEVDRYLNGVANVQAASPPAPKRKGRRRKGE